MSELDSESRFYEVQKFKSKAGHRVSVFRIVANRMFAPKRPGMGSQRS